MIRLRDSLIKMGEELSQAAMAEAQQRESSQYYQRRLEELKADMEELVQREAEASRRCMELVSTIPGAGSPAMEGLRFGRGKSLGPVGWAESREKLGGDGQRDDAVIGCKPWGGRQSGPMAFPPGWSPSSFVSQTPVPASHIPHSKGRAGSCEKKGICVY